LDSSLGTVVFIFLEKLNEYLMLDAHLEGILRKRLQGKLPGAHAQDKMRAHIIHEKANRKPFELPPQEGAVMILLYPDEHASDWKFPLIQRPPYDGIHGGQISFPGGKKDHTDRDLLQTALRETHEEIGISDSNISIIGRLSRLQVEASNHVILPVIGFMSQKPIFTPHPYEVAEIIEIPLANLFEKNVIKEKELLTRGVTLRAPYYDVDDRFIWGATAMILNELVTLIRP
jgi:8-oxo-dGTP pyrophosphatase MutT (NUDIX family)|tara:strand:- start:3898 stop:4590 length:693 start_codon:yes stop_codon:yes gene_type:complete